MLLSLLTPTSDAISGVIKAENCILLTWKAMVPLYLEYCGQFLFVCIGSSFFSAPSAFVWEEEMVQRTWTNVISERRTCFMETNSKEQDSSAWEVYKNQWYVCVYGHSNLSATLKSK